MIANQQSVRRLTAVMVADVAGYVRLMEANEETVHARFIALRDDVIEPLVGAICGILLFGDSIGWPLVAGALLIIAAAVAVTRAPQQSANQESIDPQAAAAMAAR